MKSLTNYILEAKFTGFNDAELKDLELLKSEIIDNNDKYLGDFISDSSRNLIYSKKTPVYGNKYLVYFESNPLSDTHKFSKTSKSENSTTATQLEPKEGFYMIGIADKFGRIFLYGKWDGKNPAFIQYKEAEVKTSYTGNKYTVKSGWKFTKKDQEYFKVQYWRDNEKKYGDHFWFPTNYKQVGIYDYDLDKKIKMIFDLNDIPNKVKEILDKIDKKAKEDAERKEKEQKNKEFWKEVDTYNHLGCANGWDETPEILKTINKDPEAKWIEVSLGRCYTQYICKKYKVTYTCDSSD